MKTVILKNFKLGFFTKLIEQNLIVNNVIDIRFSQEFVKSAAKTSSDSLVKLWSVPTSNLISDGEEDGVMNLDFNDDGTMGPQIPEFEEFNMYVLKGDMFMRFLKVFNDEPVTMTIDVDEEDSVATKMIVKGHTKSNSSVEISFTLSSTELINNPIKDYNVASNYMKPEEGVPSFYLLKEEIDEVKNLIKNLHKTSVENCSYIAISVDPDKKVITVYDKVFKVKFQLSKSEKDIEKLPKTPIEFRILKSDFLVCGKHTFEFFYDESIEKIIMKTSYKKFDIFCSSNNLSLNSESATRNGNQGQEDIEEVEDLDDILGSTEEDYFA